MTAQAAVAPQAVVDWRPIVARFQGGLQIEKAGEVMRKAGRRQQCVALADLRKLGLTLAQLGELFGMSGENARQMIASVGCETDSTANGQ